MPSDFLSYSILVIVALLSCLKGITQKYFSKRNNPTLKDNLIFVGVMSFIVVIFLSIFYLRSLPSIETLIYGLIIGVIMFIFQLTYIISFSIGPLSISGTIVSLAIIFPSVYGMCFLNEPSNVFKLIGIVLVIISLILLNIKKSDNNKASLKWFICIIIAFISNGVSYILKTHFSTLSAASERNELLIISYLVAGILSFILSFIYKPKEKPTLKIDALNIVLPIIVGVLLALHNSMMMLGLSCMDASYYYPISSSIYLLFILLAGIILYKEKPTVFQYVGVSLAILAVIFINIII